MAFNFPIISDDNSSREYQEEFQGYNHNIRINDSEFYDMKNMTGDYYPVLSPRDKRSQLRIFDKPQGIIYKNELWYVSNNRLYKEDTEIKLIDCVTNEPIVFSDGEKQLVSMGAYIAIFPDKVYVNTTNLSDCGYVSVRKEFNSDYKIILRPNNGEKTINLNDVSFVCDSKPENFMPDLGGRETAHHNIKVGKLWLNTSNKNIYECTKAEKSSDNTYTYEWTLVEEADYKNYIHPASEYGYIKYITSTEGGTTYATSALTVSDIPNGALWRDTSTIENKVKQWSKDYSMWIDVTYNYVNIQAIDSNNNLFRDWDNLFKIDDSITISGVNSIVDGNRIITELNSDSITILANTNIKNTLSISNAVIERKCPDLDFVVESNNRLWGCYRGTSSDGKILNEIYCSKQGYLWNWYDYRSTSAGAWTASVGSDGDFTGAIVYGGSPWFFKENCVHRIYGSMPSDYQISTTQLRGVQKGSGKSICVLNEALIYKSSEGVMMCDGSIPYSISEALGKLKYKNAVACGYENKYYISMQDKNDIWHLFVYNTNTQMWHKEDNIKIDYFCKTNDDLMFISNNKLMSVSSGKGIDEDNFDWFIETGNIGYSYSDNKYIGRMLLRIGKPVESRVNVLIRYDDMTSWIPIAKINGFGTKTHNIPIIPQRCDHFALRIEGQGECKIYSLSKVIEIGSDYYG